MASNMCHQLRVLLLLMLAAGLPSKAHSLNKRGSSYHSSSIVPSILARNSKNLVVNRIGIESDLSIGKGEEAGI